MYELNTKNENVRVIECLFRRYNYIERANKFLNPFWPKCKLLSGLTLAHEVGACFAARILAKLSSVVEFKWRNPGTVRSTYSILQTCSYPTPWSTGREIWWYS